MRPAGLLARALHTITFPRHCPAGLRPTAAPSPTALTKTHISVNLTASGRRPAGRSVSHYVYRSGQRRARRAGEHTRHRIMYLRKATPPSSLSVLAPLPPGARGPRRGGKFKFLTRRGLATAGLMRRPARSLSARWPCLPCWALRWPTSLFLRRCRNDAGSPAGPRLGHGGPWWAPRGCRAFKSPRSRCRLPLSQSNRRPGNPRDNGEGGGEVKGAVCPDELPIITIIVRYGPIRANPGNESRGGGGGTLVWSANGRRQRPGRSLGGLLEATPPLCRGVRLENGMS